MTAVSLVAGWVALWPIRERLGPGGYHLAAYPVGLVLWPTAFALLSLLGLGLWLPSVIAALAVTLFVATSLLELGAGDSDAGSPVAVWTYAGWGFLVLGVAAAVGLSGITSAAYDSVFHYERWGMWLADGGPLTVDLAGAYSLFIPSVHAANRFFGADWTSTPYPVLSLHVAATLVMAVGQWGRRRVGPGVSATLAAVFMVLLVTTPRYIHHTLYVHSHMITAAYLAIALYSLQRAYLGGHDAGESVPGPTQRAWALVAGLMSGGFALTRTDGIAYVALIIAVASLLHLESPRSRPTHALFVGATAVPIALSYWSLYAELGMWEARKLSGETAALVLLVLSVGVLLTLFASLLPRLGEWLTVRGHAMALTVVLEVIALVALAVLFTDTFIEATTNMATNLFRTGGNGYLWYFAAGTVLASLLWGGQWRAGRWPRYVFFSMVTFFVIAIAVHTTGHPGRPSPADSFNRVSFHVIPLVFWYVAMVVTSLVAEYRGTPDDREQRVPGRYPLSG